MFTQRNLTDGGDSMENPSLLLLWEHLFSYFLLYRSLILILTPSWFGLLLDLQSYFGLCWSWRFFNIFYSCTYINRCKWEWSFQLNSDQSGGQVRQVLLFVKNPLRISTIVSGIVKPFWKEAEEMIVKKRSISKLSMFQLILYVSAVVKITESSAIIENIIADTVRASILFRIRFRLDQNTWL